MTNTFKLDQLDFENFFNAYFLTLRNRRYSTRGKIGAENIVQKIVKKKGKNFNHKEQSAGRSLNSFRWILKKTNSLKMKQARSIFWLHVS